MLLSLFAQFVVTGIASGLAIFGANIALDWYRRPILSVDRQDFSKVVAIDISLFNINVQGFPTELSEFKVRYIVNRVTIKNKSRSAAENCKGVLRINDIEEKICWYVPSERYTMTINSDSEEYLDVCAILEENPELIYTKLNEFISKFGNDAAGSEATTYVRSIYKTYSDIPVIITPTENGWLVAHLDRKIQPGNATLMVTTKNARKTLKRDITILNKPNSEGKIVEWK